MGLKEKGGRGGERTKWVLPCSFSSLHGASVHLPLLPAVEKCLLAPLPDTGRRYQPCLALSLVTSPQAQYYLFTIRILITLCFSYVQGYPAGFLGRWGGVSSTWIILSGALSEQNGIRVENREEEEKEGRNHMLMVEQCWGVPYWLTLAFSFRLCSWEQ